MFGFHFARLDVREHAARHGAAIAEVLSALGVHEAYASLAPPSAVALLAREIAERRPLIPVRPERASATRHAEVIGTFRALGDAAARPPRRRDRSPTSSPAPRSPPTCSRCCC